MVYESPTLGVTFAQTKAEAYAEAERLTAAGVPDVKVDRLMMADPYYRRGYRFQVWQRQ